MRKTALTTLAFAVIWLAGCMTTSEIEYAVVYDGAVAMKKPPAHNTRFSYPWQNSSEVLYWTCGFAQLTYNDTPIKEARSSYADQVRRRTTYLAMIGEWCKVTPFLFEESHRSQRLIAYRRWKGRKYLLESSVVYQDNDGADYIAEKDFIEHDELKQLLRNVAQGSDNTGCFWPENPKLELMRETEDLVRVGDNYCFRAGVYLQDLARSLGTRSD